MKKLAPLAITLASALTLSACTGTDSQEAPETTAAQTAQKAEPKVNNESICERVVYWDSNIYERYEVIQPEIAQYVEIATHPNLAHIDDDLAKYVALAAQTAKNDVDSNEKGLVTSNLMLAKITCENLGY